MRKLAALWLLLTGTVYAVAQIGPSFNPMLPLRAAVPSISYQTEASNATGGSTYTFTNQAIGTADPTRCIIVGVMGKANAASSTSVSSATAGQIALIPAIDFSEGTAGTGYVGFIRGRVPQGTTANITVNFSALMSRAAVGIWAAYNLTNCGPATTAQSSASPGVVSLNTRLGDIITAVAFNNTGSSMAWAGVTERFDDAGFGGNGGGADTITTVPTESHTTTVTYTGGPTLQAAVSALWR